ncbi:hypothetical protein E2562_005763 [Oryza meyeriana var. granulata]|uniref:Uncharacterized protein n=1 Tax=Oryza meyeriana var. granulata TaxID=110450 RepID=A0A6G1F4J0_9ORYZ|nr:hypothetical protein E2562_005763 [Oryza meyeriana var. granulata]
MVGWYSGGGRAARRDLGGGRPEAEVRRAAARRPSGLGSRRPTGGRRAPSRRWCIGRRAGGASGRQLRVAAGVEKAKGRRHIGRRAGSASGRQLHVAAGVEKAKGEAASCRAVGGLGEEAARRGT